MKNLKYLICFSLSMLLITNSSLLSNDASAQVSVFMNLINQEKFKEASAMASTPMQAFLSEEKIDQFWSSFKSRYGKPISIGEPIPQKSTKDPVFLVKLRFISDSINARVMVDSNNQISGLLFVPFPKNYAFALPEYADSTKYTEKEVTFGLEGWELPATFTVPKGSAKYPAVVLVHGSGPNDRDETVGGNKVFRDIAVGLASQGIAVLRYEKRTREHSKKVIKMNKTLTIKEETIDDAVEAAKFLKLQTEINPKKVFILGHSQGGYAMPRIITAYPDLAGAIIMNGNARKLHELIPDQYEYIFGLDGEISDYEKVELERINMQTELLRKGQINENTAKDSLLLGLPPVYWLDLLSYDPPQLAKSVKIPMLIMQGGNDYQVVPSELEIWKKNLSGMKNIEFRLFDKANHLMILSEGKANPSEYEKSGHVKKEVIDAIIGWIKKK